MKRLITLSLAFFLLASISRAAAVITPAPATAAPTPAMKASQIMIPLGKTGKMISLQDLATIKASDLEKMTGQKMGFFHRLEFKLAQKKLRQSINADGTINNKRLAALTAKAADGETGFHAGGFFLGFLLGLIGILIAYLIMDEKRRNRVKWAWIGFAVWVVIVLLIII
jgi:hypothetical protein